MRTFGLIPAAGKSVRMGRPKLLLPLGGRTVLECVVNAVKAGGVNDVLVVVSPANDGLFEAAERAGAAAVLRMADETPDMRATCQMGLDFLEWLYHPAPDDGWLLLPADHPTVELGVVRALLKAAREQPERSIFVPIHAGKRGHPVWLRWRHAKAICTLPPGQGLNTFIRQHYPETLELPWPSDEVLRDLDTPEDYRKLIGG